MKQEIPSKWLPYVIRFPMLEEAVHWEPLRQWSLSDVWRVTLTTGETIIAKLGNESMAGEVKIYQSVLQPLDLPHPRLYATFEDFRVNAFLMEDLGQTTIEMNPTMTNFSGAARTLAAMRKTALRNVDALKPSVYNEYFKCQVDVMQDFEYVIQSHSLYSVDELDLLKSCSEKLPKHLSDLYKKCPVTITHNDYNAKNLMVVDDSIVPIDWSNAYLSPHLGDLYSLLSEAQGSGVDKSIVIEAYRELDDIDDIEWHVQVGGICWLLRGLCWVCEEGVHKVPVTQSWISPMITAINECFEQF